MSASEICSKVGDEVWSSYFKFCVVRNPYERLISLFYFTHRDVACTEFDEQHRERFVRWLAVAKMVDSSTWYKIDGRVCMDFLVRFERLHEDVRAVCLRLGLEWNDLAMPAYKSGIRPVAATVATMYTEQARQLVESRYEVELRELGYTFAPMAG